MADDKEVLREIWEGRLPVCFSLSPDDVTTVEPPEPCYLLVPRMTYFPLVTDKVFRHFQKASNQDNIDDMWLEFDGQPLKWHLPIGALFDLYGPENLPWNITVHFKRFPDKEILKCDGRETVEAHYMSAVKEADSLKHRSYVMNSMKKNDHKQLWLGLSNDKFDQFWSVNKRLMERVNSEPFRYVPLRFHLSDGTMLQKLFKTVSDQSELHTFGELLHSCIPYVMANEESKTELAEGWKILVQGLTPPLVTPVQWMSEHLSYPDNFLHIIVLQV